MGRGGAGAIAPLEGVLTNSRDAAEEYARGAIADYFKGHLPQGLLLRGGSVPKRQRLGEELRERAGIDDVIISISGFNLTSSEGFAHAVRQGAEDALCLICPRRELAECFTELEAIAQSVWSAERNLEDLLLLLSRAAEANDKRLIFFLERIDLLKDPDLDGLVRAVKRASQKNYGNVSVVCSGNAAQAARLVGLDGDASMMFRTITL